MKKVLVIRFSSIGDIVLTSPVVRCIKEQIPNVELHFLTKLQFKEVVENNTNIDKIWYYDKSLSAIITQLKAEHFDYIVDLHNNLRTFIIKSRLRVKSSAFNKLNFEKWLLVNLKINRLPLKHIVDRYMDAAVPLGIKNDDKGLEYTISSKDEVNTTELPQTHQNGYIAIVVGAQHTTKKLTNAKLIELCNAINLPIVLLGGRDDSANAEIVRDGTVAAVYNACGKYRLNQSASLIRQAVAVITHDTGLMHIAAAFNKKIISVWGNTIPEFGMYPYLPEQSEGAVIIENNELDCRPCSKIGFKECPRKHFKCINELDMSNIAMKVKQLQ